MSRFFEGLKPCYCDINTALYLADTFEALEKMLPEKIDMIFKHLDYLFDFESDKRASLEIRMHIGWYLKGIPNANSIKREIFTKTSVNEIKEVLGNLKKSLHE